MTDRQRKIKRLRDRIYYQERKRKEGRPYKEYGISSSDLKNMSKDELDILSEEMVSSNPKYRTIETSTASKSTRPESTKSKQEQFKEKQDEYIGEVAKIGEVIYDNFMEWVDSQGDKGQGKTGIWFKEQMDEIIGQLGKDNTMAAIQELGSEEFNSIARDTVYYEGKDFTLASALAELSRTLHGSYDDVTQKAFNYAYDADDQEQEFTL